MAAHRSGDSRRLDPLSGRFTDYIVIDTETTGLSVRKGAKLIEIGAVKIRNDELVDEFDQLINPFEHVPSRITGLTGIDDGMLLGKPDVREVMDEFARWCSDTAVVMAHNASFDMSFLDNAVQLAYSERDARFAHHFVDTLDLSRRLHPENEATKFPPSSSTTTSPTWRSTAHCPTPGRSGCCTAPCVTRPSCSACSDSLTSFEHFDPVFSHRCLLIYGWIICSASCRSRRHLHWRRTLHWVRSSERNRSVGGRRWLNRIWRHS